MTARREAMMAAAFASLSAALPGRTVRRGLADPSELGDEALRPGVFCLVAERTAGWQQHLQRESELGTTDFAIVFYGCLPAAAADDDTLAVEQLEAQAEGEVLAWCQSIKPEPIDAVYPKEATYSRGIDAPLAWVVMKLEALYV